MSIELTEMRSLLERTRAKGGAREILAVLAPKDQRESSLEERFDVLRRYWHCFSHLHEIQTERGPSLWGLVDERRDSPNVRIIGNTAYENPYHDRLWESLLPKELQADIERLWRLKIDLKQPAEPVVEHFPQALMAETFGPALRFWHGCALTAWFVAEGPYSRTSLSSLSTYYRKLLEELQRLDCPVDPSLLSELAAAEIAQGPPAPVTKDLGAEGGVSISMSLGGKTGGFGKYRNIITRYRDGWTAAHLDSYLHARVQAELAPVVDFIATSVTDKGRMPNASQVAKRARHVIDHWLGGNASAVLESFPDAARKKRKTQVESETLKKHSYRKAAAILRNISKDPPWLRFALIGGPPGFHVHSSEWARAAFTLADRVLKVERRFMPQVFGFVLDVDYVYGPHGPIRDVMREVAGVPPTTERQDSLASPSRKETLPTRPPRRGRWYIGRRRWTGTRPPPAVYIYSVERVVPGTFEEAGRGLWNAALRNRVPPPLIVMPDGAGGRTDSRPLQTRDPRTGESRPAVRDCERDRMSQFLPSEFVQVPLKAAPSVQLTSVVLETGRRVPAKTFDAALTYLESQHGTSLTVWDVLNDPLLSEVAVSAAGERPIVHED
jgi:hypothetical protein